MQRGTKPKPVELRLVEGNPGKRAVPEDVPPGVGVPVRPAWLDAAAVEVWDTYLPLLPWLTQTDSETFAQWCSLVTEFRGDPHGMSPPRMGRMHSLAGELGMSPSSRTRLGYRPKPDGAKNKYLT